MLSKLLAKMHPGAVRVGVMHLAKGLEFKAVAVRACDEDQLPLRSRLETVADEVELDEVSATERQLFYVAVHVHGTDYCNLGLSSFMI